MDNLFCFTGGNQGSYQVIKMEVKSGPTLQTIAHLDIYPASLKNSANECNWVLIGFISNLIYAESLEKKELVSIQSDLGKGEPTCAVLIPMKKSATWWSLAQDERREIFEK